MAIPGFEGHIHLQVQKIIPVEFSEFSLETGLIGFQEEELVPESIRLDNGIITLFV